MITDITATNILIAEFLGFQHDRLGWCDTDEALPAFVIQEEHGNTFDAIELNFHKSWDWLMPAVSKAYEMDDVPFGDITHALLDVNLDETYKAVLLFLDYLKLKR